MSDESLALLELLPLRCKLNQSALRFLRNFFAYNSPYSSNKKEKGNGNNDDEEDRIVGDVTSCIVYRDKFDNKKLRVAPTPRDSMQHVDEDAVLDMQCAMCKKLFSSQARLDQHVCQGVVGQRDLIHVGTKCAIESIDQPNFLLIVANSNDNANVFGQMGNVSLVTEHFKGGWACSKKHGGKCGRKHAGPFKNDIEEMFLIGRNDIAKRLGPGKMLDLLKKNILKFLIFQAKRKFAKLCQHYLLR